MNGSSSKYVLGISCYYHDAAAVLLKDGVIVAAAAEERFTRKKHDSGFPKQAIDFCLKEGGIDAAALRAVAFYDKPLLKFDRIVTSLLAAWPRSHTALAAALPVWMRQKLWVRGRIRKELGYRGDIFFFEHHESHAASAFYVSPFPEAAVLTIDGVGEWATASIARGVGTTLDVIEELHYPNSLGLLYASVTAFLGFETNDAEYKVMGAAAYGKPTYAPDILEHIDLKADGSFRLDPESFCWEEEVPQSVARLSRIFGLPPRQPESQMTEVYANVAASVQAVTEEITVRMARHAKEVTGMDRLCLAGGVALNVVAHRKIREAGIFTNTWVQPAAGDDGGALGAALLAHHRLLGGSRSPAMTHAAFGPEFSEEEIESVLQAAGLSYARLDDDRLFQEVARLLGEQHIIGWFQGRMEWGPRALGNRSILADPRRVENRDRVNAAVKFREPFRPFAPAVLKEDAGAWFDSDRPEPFMTNIARVIKQDIPAVTHVDGTARVQTVSDATNSRFAALLRVWKSHTGCSVLLNTSFNVRGEPIVCTPEDAIRCFERTGLSALAMGPFFLRKAGAGMEPSR